MGKRASLAGLVAVMLAAACVVQTEQLEGQVGPQGQQGEQGPAGEAGLHGDAGPQGDAGPPGQSSPWQTNGADIYYSAGHVGVGTDSPVGMLHVVDPLGVGDDRAVLALGDSSYPYEWRAIISPEIGGMPAGTLRLTAVGTSYTEMAITPEGRVGIGVTDPTATLTLEERGSGHSEVLLRTPSTSWKLRANASTGNFSFINETDIRTPVKVGSLANTDLLQVGMSAANQVDIDGRLDVNGPIYQRGGELHADYVFDPGYRLESIAEHAASMWNNRHLPAIPAARLDEGGRPVMEVGRQMRGAVEELEKAHIYIAQLHDTLGALSQDNQALRAELDELRGTTDSRLRRLEAAMSREVAGSHTAPAIGHR